MLKKKKILKLSLLILPLSFLTSCDINDFLHLKEDMADKIFPNIWDFLVQFIAFIIMIALVTIFAYKPIKKYLNKRKELLAKEVEEAKKNNEEAKANLMSSSKEIALAHQKAQEILKRANEEALSEKEKILHQANEEAKMQIIKANIEIENNKTKAEDELKKELGSVAIDLSKKVLEREVNEEDNAKIIDDFINKMK